MQNSDFIVLVDLDGCIRDLHDAIFRVHNAYYNAGEPLLKSDHPSWDISEVFGIDTETFYQRYFVDYVEELNDITFPFKDYKCLEVLGEYAFVHIVTSQWRTAQPATMNWLSKFNVYYDSVTFTARKDLIRGNIILEDRPETLEALHALGQLKVFIRDHEYNRGLSFYNRVRNLSEFCEHCRDMYEKKSYKAFARVI